MIKFADKEDIYSIRSLWETAFPEEPDFNEYFFKNIFDHKNTLVYIKNNEIASMAQMLPYNIKDIGEVTYIYGAATMPKYRKMGLMSELLKSSFEIDVKLGRAASILIPANKPLFKFYENIGYDTAFYMKQCVYNKNLLKGDAIEAEYSHIERLMDIYSGSVERSCEYWRVQIDMYKALGGKIYIYNSAYAVVSDKIEELMYINERDRDIVINYVCDHLGTDSVEACEKGGNVPFGMIKRHKEFESGNMYMNLMFN